ncbi:hypothetical protein [Desulfocurvibacter africanus]|uniref:hypothetical protein n=1 Tax=Desulfocurvibacter africanus TaxID=873 RepID=UPI00047F5817|nr:hypothetical protein [Desulfocurvibacter africanus]
MEIEKLQREAGFNPPVSQMILSKKDRIRLPTGYIRTTDYFNAAYSIYPLVKDKLLKQNITYAFQYGDFLNFIANRFDIGLSVQSIFYKYQIINLYTIIEALIRGCMKNLNDYCDGDGKCPITECKYRSIKFDAKDLLKVINEFRRLEVLHWDRDDVKMIDKCRRLRNNIHIHITDESELNSDEYTMKNFNDFVVRILHNIRDNFYPNFKEHFQEMMKNCQRKKTDK